MCNSQKKAHVSSSRRNNSLQIASKKKWRQSTGLFVKTPLTQPLGFFSGFVERSSRKIGITVTEAKLITGQYDTKNTSC